MEEEDEEKTPILRLREWESFESIRNSLCGEPQLGFERAACGPDRKLVENNFWNDCILARQKGRMSCVRRANSARNNAALITPCTTMSREQCRGGSKTPRAVQSRSQAVYLSFPCFCFPVPSKKKKRFVYPRKWNESIFKLIFPFSKHLPCKTNNKGFIRFSLFQVSSMARLLSSCLNHVTFFTDSWLLVSLELIRIHICRVNNVYQRTLWLRTSCM